MAIHQRRSSWFVTLPIAATAVIFLSLIFFPTAHSIRDTRNEIKLKQDYIQQTSTLTTTMQQLQDQLREIETYRMEWEARMETKSELAKLFGEINARARESGAVTTHFEPLPEKSMEVLHLVPVKMSVVGSYPEVCRLLAALEQMPEGVWVDQLTVKRSREAGKNVEAELKLEVFTVNSKKSS